MTVVILDILHGVENQCLSLHVLFGTKFVLFSFELLYQLLVFRFVRQKPSQ